MPTPRKAKAKTATAEKPKAAPVKAKPPVKKSPTTSAAPAASKSSAKSPPPAPPPRPAVKAKPASAPRFEKKPPPEPPPLLPRKLSDSDRQWMLGIRDMLIKRRDELANVVQSSQAQLAQKPTDSADVSDRASEGFEDELAVGLIAIEAAQLDDIEDAIRRIDDSTYGQCANCGKPIPRKRLEILPFARRCIACEGTVERMPKAQSAYEEEPLD